VHAEFTVGPGTPVPPTADTEARAAIDQMNRTNAEMFDRLLDGVAAEDIPNISFGISAALSNALTVLLTGMLTSYPCP
jgi:TetR/AcrR family transcriptional regulator, cholesterol catabolism regulator